MDRVYNFSAGPSMLPLEVLKRAQSEMLNYDNTGMSVMEMSHRSKAFEKIIRRAEELMRKLMNIPDNYKVMFLQGGASTQFAMVPMNLLKKSKKADYVITGNWSKKAASECEKYGEVNRVASSADKTFAYIPEPETGDVPLVADISSMILSQKLDVSKFGLLYAGAQKNIAPAGLTVAIMREDLIGDTLPGTPTMLKYSTHAENGSMYNTPPCYCIYICMLVMEWLEELGGVEEMEKINVRKAGLFYDFLDNSKMFKGTVEKKDRSLMNVPFVTGNADLDAKFIEQATAAGFVNLKGHRTVGGMRASIYNAMPEEGVLKLIDFMKKFEKEN